jgi:hypothetical protein
MKSMFVAIVLVASLLGIHGNALAGDQFHRTFDLPAALSLNIQTAACSGTPGPQVMLQGDVTFTGLNASVNFRGAGPQNSQPPISVGQVVVPANQAVSTPSQSITAGLGANPYIWVQIVDAKGRPLTSEIFLGRCEQGTFTPAVNLSLPTEANGTVTASGCGAPTGPTVMVDGAAQVAPFAANLIFRSADPATTPNGKILEVVNQAVILPSGQTYSFPTQPIVANSAANPLVSMQFSLEGGAVIGPDVSLGRCSSLTIQ